MKRMEEAEGLAMPLSDSAVNNLAMDGIKESFQKGNVILNLIQNLNCEKSSYCCKQEKKATDKKDEEDRRGKGLSPVLKQSHLSESRYEWQSKNTPYLRLSRHGRRTKEALSKEKNTLR